MRINCFRLALSLLFILPFFSGISTLFAESTEKSQQLYLVGNDDALLANRKQALDQLMADPDEETCRVVLKLLGKTARSSYAKEFRVYLHEQMVSHKNPVLFSFFKEKLMEPDLAESVREEMLAILWKADPEGTRPLVRRLIHNPSEVESLRTTAIMCLIDSKLDGETYDIGLKIFSNRRESPNMRRAVVDLLLTGEDIESFKKSYLKAMTDSSEDHMFRQNLITKSIFIDFLDIENVLLGMLKEERNSTELRQAAIYALGMRRDRIEAVMPEIRRLAQIETNFQIKEDLQVLIDQVKQQQ